MSQSSKSLILFLIMFALGQEIRGAFAFSTPIALSRCVSQLSTNFFTSSPKSSRPRRYSSLSASTVIERTKDKTIEILNDEKVEENQKYGGEGWEIRLFNDPFNKREFVARCLSTVCGKSDTESYQIMMQAHKNGYVAWSPNFLPVGIHISNSWMLLTLWFLYLAALWNRMGVVGRYNLEIAELYYKSLKENGLTVVMVQVDDE
jgi:ATP-dependent Clp protease adapter protein ClpS